MRVANFASAVTTVALASSSAAFQYPLRPCRDKGFAKGTYQLAKVENLRNNNPNLAKSFDSKLTPLKGAMSADFSLPQLPSGETIEALQDVLESITALQESQPETALALGVLCLLYYLNHDNHLTDKTDRVESELVRQLPEKIKQARTSIMHMSKEHMSREKLMKDLEEILELINKRMPKGNQPQLPPDDDPDDPDDPDVCTLPVYWEKLGLAYEQSSYGDRSDPRIIVDTSAHPQLDDPGCPFESVKYVITHSDGTGQLKVSVVPKDHELDEGNFYQAFMRDEVLAEFVRKPETCEPFLVFRTHVGKGDHGKGSSAEEVLESMRGWSSSPGWQNCVTAVTKAWLNARLKIFDSHRFHPVEGLLEVLDPSFKLNPQWEDARVVWVNQSGDPDFNTVHDVGTVKGLMKSLRSESEEQKQQKHDDNKEKAWREAIDGGKDLLKDLCRRVLRTYSRPENAALRQEIEHIFMAMAILFNDLFGSGPK